MTLVMDSGQRYGRLVLVGYTETYNSQRMFLCRCDCGGEKVVRGSHLREGLIQSCGCLMREVNAERLRGKRTHGATVNGDRPPEYQSWLAMKSRCLNPRATGYDQYGGRGITICEAWRQDFAAFIDDMGSRPHGTSLDRIDPDGHYESSNCRWATAKEQANNRRCSAEAKAR